jgi:hypothetical protein
MLTIKLVIYNALNDKRIPAKVKCVSAALRFISEKWTTLLDQTQELISETTASDGTSLFF